MLCGECCASMIDLDRLRYPQALAELAGMAEQTIFNRHSNGGDLLRPMKLGRLLCSLQQFFMGSVEPAYPSRQSFMVMKRSVAHRCGHSSTSLKTERPPSCSRCTARGTLLKILLSSSLSDFSASTLFFAWSKLVVSSLCLFSKTSSASTKY